jgi:glycerol-3-phosphate dehydrogenase
VEQIERREDTGEVVAVSYRDRHTGERGRLTTSAVVNATGAWSPITASLSGLPASHARVRPGKGIHVVYDRRLTNYAITCGAIDGRQIFLEPWQNMTVVGTTDDDYYGDLDDVRATSEEVRYLVQGDRAGVPRRAQGAQRWAPTRACDPPCYTYGKLEDALPRARHRRPHAPRRARPVLDDRRQARELPAVRRGDDRRARRAVRLSVRCATHIRAAARRRRVSTRSPWRSARASTRWRRGASSTATGRARRASRSA